MKNRFGFSLAEMMVVLLIVAVVLAATAPMITRKISRERSDKIFDMLSSDPNEAVDYVKGRSQIIYMNARNNGYVGIRESGDKIPINSVLFGYNNYDASSNPKNFVGLGFGTKNALNSVAIGYSERADEDSVVIGIGYLGAPMPYENGKKVVSIGYKALANDQGVAIGYNADAKGKSSLAIGAKAVVENGTTYHGKHSVAIGYNAIVRSANNAVAIGYNASVGYSNTIVLGTENDTVYIPGNLVVEHAALIGRAGTRNDNLYFLPYAQEDGRHFSVLSAGDWKGEDSNVVMVRSLNHSKVPKVKVGSYETGYDEWHPRHGGSAHYADNHYAFIDFDNPSNSSSAYVGASYFNGSTHRDPSSCGIGTEPCGVVSDIRLKNVGEPFAGGLAELSKLNLYNFTFKNDENKTPHVGVMAQNLQEVFPNAVTENKDGYLQIRWDEMFYSAINAIKELNTKVIAIGEKLQQVTLDIVNLKALTERQQLTIDEQTKVIEEQQQELDKLTVKVEKLERKKRL